MEDFTRVVQTLPRAALRDVVEDLAQHRLRQWASGDVAAAAVDDAFVEAYLWPALDTAEAHSSCSEADSDSELLGAWGNEADAGTQQPPPNDRLVGWIEAVAMAGDKGVRAQESGEGAANSGDISQRIQEAVTAATAAALGYAGEAGGAEVNPSVESDLDRCNGNSQLESSEDVEVLYRADSFDGQSESSRNRSGSNGSNGSRSGDGPIVFNLDGDDAQVWVNVTFQTGLSANRLLLTGRADFDVQISRLCWLCRALSWGWFHSTAVVTDGIRKSSLAIGAQKTCGTQGSCGKFSTKPGQPQVEVLFLNISWYVRVFSCC